MVARGWSNPAGLAGMDRPRYCSCKKEVYTLYLGRSRNNAVRSEAGVVGSRHLVMEERAPASRPARAFSGTSPTVESRHFRSGHTEPINAP